MDAGSIPPLGRQDRAEHEGLISAVLASRPHPQQGFRTCFGMFAGFAGSMPAALKRSPPAPSNWASSTARASPRSSPESPTAPPPRTAVPPRCSTTPICVAAAITIERISSCSLIPRSTICTRLAFTAGQRIQGTGTQARSARPRSRRMARPAARIRVDAAQAKAVRNARQGRQAAPFRQRRRRQLSKSSRARPRAVPQARRLRLDRRAPQPADHRCQWPGQELARLRPRPQGVPREHVRSLHPHAPALHRSRHRPRRRALRPAPALPGARQAAHPR